MKSRIKVQRKSRQKQPSEAHFGDFDLINVRPIVPKYQLRFEEAIPYKNARRLYNGKHWQCGRGQEYWKK